ncbi:lytic murein transglycosylase [Thermocrispum agreste]
MVRESPDDATPSDRDGGKCHVRGIALRSGVALAVLAALGGGVWGLTRVSEPEPGPTTMEIPALSVQAADVEPGTVAPVSISVKDKPRPGAKSATSAKSADKARTNDGGAGGLRAWAERTGKIIGVPPRALLAYGRAEIAIREAQPGCRLSWATLAGIGRVESNHGQFGGAVLTEAGWPSKLIIGVPLNGSGGVRAIKDTDGGRYDGDTEVDRAVGPMQFIPSTWQRWASDGNGDGRADPQQIDDAALAAARYLCAGGRDMASAKGWWEGLWSYNRSVEYAQKVFAIADGYARAVKQ